MCKHLQAVVDFPVFQLSRLAACELFLTDHDLVWLSHFEFLQLYSGFEFCVLLNLIQNSTVNTLQGGFITNKWTRYSILLLWWSRTLTTMESRWGKSNQTNPSEEANPCLSLGTLYIGFLTESRHWYMKDSHRVIHLVWLT